MAVSSLTDSSIIKYDISDENRREIALLQSPGVFDKRVSAFLALSLEEINKQCIARDQEQRHFVFIDRDSNYIIKIGLLQSGDFFNEVIHEGAIGFVLNALNDKHFAPVNYAKIRDECPNVIPNEESPTGCAYVVYKRIPGPTLHEFVDDSRAITPVWKKILLDLFTALYRANQTYGFTHYDLHYDNVIITTDRISSELYPVIIDYGSSYISANINGKNEHFGRTCLEGAILIQSMWQHDVFKILAFLHELLSPEIVRKTRKDKLQSEIDVVEYYISNLETYYYHTDPDVIADMIEDLKDDPEGIAAYRAEQTGYARDLENQTAEHMMLKHQLDMIDTKPLPVRAYDLLPIINKLLEFFMGQPVSIDIMIKYKANHRYYQPDDRMISIKFNFDEFMFLVRDVLG